MSMVEKDKINELRNLSSKLEDSTSTVQAKATGEANRSSNDQVSI